MWTHSLWYTGNNSFASNHLPLSFFLQGKEIEGKRRAEGDNLLWRPLSSSSLTCFTRATRGLRRSRRACLSFYVYSIRPDLPEWKRMQRATVGCLSEVVAIETKTESCLPVLSSLFFSRSSTLFSLFPQKLFDKRDEEQLDSYFVVFPTHTPRTTAVPCLLPTCMNHNSSCFLSRPSLAPLPFLSILVRGCRCVHVYTLRKRLRALMSRAWVQDFFQWEKSLASVVITRNRVFRFHRRHALQVVETKCSPRVGLFRMSVCLLFLWCVRRKFQLKFGSVQDTFLESL